MTNLIGTQVFHGSPGYENEECIYSIFVRRNAVEIEFESGAFTTLSHDDFHTLLVEDRIAYTEKHGGASVLSFRPLH